MKLLIIVYGPKFTLAEFHDIYSYRNEMFHNHMIEMTARLKYHSLCHTDILILLQHYFL